MNHYFFENIQRALKVRKMTQTQLAKKIGRGQTSVYQYVHEGGNPPLEVLVQMVRVLDLNMHRLFFEFNYHPDVPEVRPEVGMVAEDAPPPYGQVSRDEFVAFKAQVQRDIRDLQEMIEAKDGASSKAG